jgi:hypothetical protein
MVRHKVDTSRPRSNGVREVVPATDTSHPILLEETDDRCVRYGRQQADAIIDADPVKVGGDLGEPRKVQHDTGASVHRRFGTQRSRSQHLRLGCVYGESANRSDGGYAIHGLKYRSCA